MKRTTAKTVTPTAENGHIHDAGVDAREEHVHDANCAHDHGGDGGGGGFVAQIRDFKNSDYDDLIAIWKAGRIEMDETDRPDVIARNIRTRANSFRVFVVEVRAVGDDGKPQDEARIAGGVTITYDGRRAYIYHFAVHPEFRGMGLGRALLNICEQQAQKWGAAHLRLTARSDGTRAVAQKLYTAQGWKATPELWVYSKALKIVKRKKR